MRLGVNGRFYGARVTGVQRFAREVARRLAGRADLVLFLPGGVEAGEGAPAGAPVVPGRLAGHAWEQLELPWRARAARCDVLLHLANTAPGWGVPNVLVAHDATALTHAEWFTRRFALWYRFAQGRAARRAACLVTVSGWARAELAGALALPESRIAVAPQGAAPFDRPAAAEAVRALRRRAGIGDGPFLLAVGGDDPRKNLPFLLEVLARWEARRGAPPPPLLVAGERAARVHADGGRPADAAPRVRYLGPVADGDLHALYTAAAALCFPSLAEGFGRPPLEALACGTPAVVAPYGPAAEVLGDAARIVPLDADRWVDALADLLADPAARSVAAERGRALAGRYHWDAAADAVLAACRDAAEREDR